MILPRFLSIILIVAMFGGYSPSAVAFDDAGAPAEVEATPAAEGTGEAADAEPRGAVLTVLTVVGPSAPAATQDMVGLVRVALTDGLNSRHAIDIPVGGSAILGALGLEANAEIEVTLFDPFGREVGANSLEVEQLSGSVGLLSLELGTTPLYRACSSCSSPEPLTEVRGLSGTLLFWSAGSEVAVGHDDDDQDDDALHVAIRAAVSATERQAIVAVAGGQIIDTVHDNERGLVWLVVRPNAATDALGVALGLAGRRGVKAVQVHHPGQSGALLVPLEPL